MAAAATTVAVPGLAAPLRVFHMSDSHVDRGTDLGYEGSAMNFGTAMHNRYEHVPDPREGEARAAKKAHTSFWREPDVVGVDGSKPTENSYHAGDGGPPEGMVRPYEIFEEQLALAQQEGAELLVHTGNLVNFPSFRAVYYCWDALENCGLPYLFTAGSADWCWQDMVGTKPVAELRQQYCWDENGEIATFFSRGKDYAPAYDPPAWSELVGGLRFVGVDNSTQLVSEEQTAFVVEALGAAAAAGESVVLCAHMPLYTPELAAALEAEQGLGPAHIDWNIDGTLDGNTALVHTTACTADCFCCACVLTPTALCSSAATRPPGRWGRTAPRPSPPTSPSTPPPRPSSRRSPRPQTSWRCSAGMCKRRWSSRLGRRAACSTWWGRGSRGRIGGWSLSRPPPPSSDSE